MKKDKPAVSTSTKPRRKRWTSDDTELTLLGLPAAIWYAVFCYLHYLFMGGVRGTEFDIVLNRIWEQIHILEYHADIFH